MIILFLFPALALFAFLSYYHHQTAVILLAALLPSYLLRFSAFSLPTNFLESTIVIVVLVGLIQPAVRSRWSTAWKNLSLLFTLLVFLFILAASVSTYISPHPYTSLGVLKSWIIAPILFAWLIYSSGIARQKIINALLISGVAVSVIGLFQIFTLDRIKSVYDVPNSLALFLAPLLVLALWQKRWLSVIPLALALVLTQSTSALVAVTLALLLGIILLANFSRRRRALYALALFFILAASYFSSTGRLAYLASHPNSISVRRQLWSVSWELVQERPLLGVGLGAFEPAYQQKLHERFAAYHSTRPGGGQAAPLPEFVFRDPHNWILSFWLNTGLAGLLSFAGLHAFTVWRLARRLQLPVTSCQLPVPALALLALLLFGLTDTIYWKNDLSALHWLLLAWLAADCARREAGANSTARLTDLVTDAGKAYKGVKSRRITSSASPD